MKTITKIILVTLIFGIISVYMEKDSNKIISKVNGRATYQKNKRAIWPGDNIILNQIESGIRTWVPLKG